MKRILTIFLSIALLASLLPGCSLGSNDPYVPTGSGLTWDEGEYTGPTTQTDPPETAQSMTLTYYPEESMNPILCTDFTNRALFSLIYQGLLP